MDYVNFCWFVNVEFSRLGNLIDPEFLPGERSGTFLKCGWWRLRYYSSLDAYGAIQNTQYREQCSAVQCSAVQCSAVQCSAVQHTHIYSILIVAKARSFPLPQPEATVLAQPCHMLKLINNLVLKVIALLMWLSHTTKPNQLLLHNRLFVFLHHNSCSNTAIKGKWQK